ncbi:oxygenase MpaB family protein [Acaryochloris sp. IP29b_bin.137]|uniref:oxygenase MpaB family protein n=1 Tax=Acaryochloris sp. IP29b_bin.137 TaxID=2969217 RepID=UPI00262D1F95|nr:oxygenase MpaB family protein [Acaryochloris sp. IP29b_bin.137]
MLRFERFNTIQQLDPIRDNCEVCRQLAGYEFPWDITRALEIALFRTFCVPSIATLLDRTAEFHHHSQKRYDDTGLMVSLILKWGHESPKGQAIIQRMNQIHGRFPISNADYIYVLSTFIYEPVRWIERFGWRQLTRLEKQALYHFWSTVGQQMGIQDIPSSYEVFEQYNQAYERDHFHYSEANQRVGQSTLTLFLSWFPVPFRPLIRPLAYAIMDDTMLNAFGFPSPKVWQRQLVEHLLQTRGKLLRFCPPRQSSSFYSDEPQRSYPKGYDLTDLGPPNLLSELNNPSVGGQENS